MRPVLFRPIRLLPLVWLSLVACHVSIACATQPTLKLLNNLALSPDVVLWPLPGELPQGIDRQLERGVDLLLEEVARAAAHPKPRYATESRKAQPK